jgi:AbrB family looped-hinge helix DNA binding protein
MKTTIDRAGRIVIPSDMRDQAGLGPGTAVEVELRDGTVTIEPASTPVKIARKGRLRVAVADHGATLSEETARSTREELRRKR